MQEAYLFTKIVESEKIHHSKNETMRKYLGELVYSLFVLI